MCPLFREPALNKSSAFRECLRNVTVNKVFVFFSRRFLSETSTGLLDSHVLGKTRSGESVLHTCCCVRAPNQNDTNELFIGIRLCFFLFSSSYLLANASHRRRDRSHAFLPRCPCFGVSSPSCGRLAYHQTSSTHASAVKRNFT